MQIPTHLAKSILCHYSRVASYAKVAPTDHRTADAIRLAGKELKKLEELIIMEEMFQDNELCDGRYCNLKKSCVRYMGNVDLTKDHTSWVNMIKKPWPRKCPFYLTEDNGHYPQIQ